MKPTLISVMDLRGLEPPEPMTRVLETLATAPAGITIEAQLERRPMFLLEELNRRGQAYTCKQKAEGLWILQLPVAASTSTTPSLT